MIRVLAVLVAAACWAQGPDGRDPNASTVWVNRPKPGSLPKGVTHHTYRSASMNRDIGYLIYLPDAYASEPARRWPPMILVMPNGGKYTYYKDSADGRYRGETTIIRELIPHIDGTYRTIAARAGRAIEGFSMGGRGATRLAIKYPNNFLGTDKARHIDNDTYLLPRKNLVAIQGRLRIHIACGTADDGHLPSIRRFHQALLDAGVDHTYLEIQGLAHKQNEMLGLYRPVWFDYHAESFRPAAR